MHNEINDYLAGDTDNTNQETGYLSGINTQESHKEDISRPGSISPLLRQDSGTESTPKSPVKMYQNEDDIEDYCQNCHSRPFEYQYL